MANGIPPGARASLATARNRGPILDVLISRLPGAGVVLEVAAGAGEHAACFAAALPGLAWRPTDADPEALASIAAWRDHACLANLAPPERLDVSDPAAWPIDRADAVVAINMLHISPWTAAQGLMAGAGAILPPGGGLFVYGPFIEPEVETAASNIAFDHSLRVRNPDWGLRRLDLLAALASEHGLELCERIAMPANNLTLVFRKRRTAAL